LVKIRRLHRRLFVAASRRVADIRPNSSECMALNLKQPEIIAKVHRMKAGHCSPEPIPTLLESAVMNDYWKIARELPTPVGHASAVAYLNKVLPPLWASRYPSAGGELLTVTLGGEAGKDGAVSTMFDLRSKGSTTDDRVVAVWGLSRVEPASTRDTGRMAGFLGGVWSDNYPGRDRGHFFAHTMGGGTDINLFPQLASVNRGGEWRRMERYAAEHPGTFCFIRPIYDGASWTPSQLEYGIYKLPPADALGIWVNVFPN
jgi:DNA/RNA non-specific endonuclease